MRALLPGDRIGALANKTSVGVAQAADSLTGRGPEEPVTTSETDWDRMSPLDRPVAAPAAIGPLAGRRLSEELGTSTNANSGIGAPAGEDEPEHEGSSAHSSTRGDQRGLETGRAFRCWNCLWGFDRCACGKRVA
jgi:hypothetical protein